MASSEVVVSLKRWLVQKGGATPSRRKIVENLLWLLIDKLLAIVDAVFIGALVARHLGPSDFGLISYSLAVIGILSTIASLGLDSWIVNRLVRNPEQRSPLLWNVTFMKIGLSITFFLAVLLIAGSQQFSEESSKACLVLVASTVPILLSPIGSFRLLLEAEVLSKWSVWINNLCLMLSAITRVVLVYLAASVLHFAMATAFFSSLSFIGVAIVVIRLGLLPAVELPSTKAMKEIAVECWPLLLTSLSVYMYMNLDVIMLKWLKSSEVAGIYSIATRISSIWYFIPLVLATSFLPNLTALHRSAPSEYSKRLQWYFDVSAIAAYACVAIALLFFPPLIAILFGPQYSESVNVFIYHIWAIPFVFLGVARGQHLIIEGHHKFNLLSTQIGLVVNVLLNFMLIPAFSAQGAAVATLISFAVSAYVSSFFVKSLRPIGYAQTRSLFSSPWRLLREPLA